jgi:tRNA pseudouridine38-40 synthase
MRKAMKILVGEHDFRSFAKTLDDDNTIRTIESFDLDINDGILEFKIVGNGFMRNMVRIIIAVILRVGEGKLEVEDVKRILDAKSRSSAPWVAPAQGLYLWKVEY